MKKNILLSVALCLSFTLNAQTLDNLKITSKKYGLSKMKKAQKKIYINSFNVNFEIYKEAIDFKAGGNGGRIGGNTSSATAKAAVGLSGVDANKMQAKTNKLFENFKQRLKSEGYEIISADVAGKAKSLEKWNKATGPFMKENIPGVITCAPENYVFYYKKKGALGLGGLGIQAKLSKELGDVIIADVNLNVMFSESGNDWMKGRAAKVKIKTNLRLVNDYVITVPQKLKKKKSTLGKLFGSVKIKGAVDTYPINSMISFSYGKAGLGSQAQFNGTLKDDAEISGVMKKEKIVAYQKQGSFTPTSFTSFSNYLDAKEDRFSKNAKWITVDSDAFANGFYIACNTFIDKQLNAFFSKIK
ncbi:hypothetical protein BXQ17_08275 [Polaribacter sp. BM10]|uniref:hypothetical protein n=1 Tax=Polaribacter sp. BM10 TaxID=1529069 RepID=UPI00098A9130|nr:hypothetical protein [Polaribacter sp. BM10]AQS94061.1 hypothetical protein BXQ17_08275 [Polaribacter sp. BM10]